MINHGYLWKLEIIFLKMSLLEIILLEVIFRGINSLHVDSLSIMVDLVLLLMDTQ